MPESSLQSLGRYIVHAELGHGGFATVYRATDTALEREVALKVLKPGWTDDPKAVERFMREAKQAARLKHPNIVTIYDVGQAEGRLFIAMELVRGRSLQQIIAEEGALAWSRVLTILEQSAAALDYAHKQGLIHRDIKPANIILDESEPSSVQHVMLTDFGLVRGAEQASLSMGTTGGLLGTPEYIAPEIWDGEPAMKASDIYALGCVAFYLLTGQVLFSATTPMAVLKRHAEGPVFPQQWPSGVPDGVDVVLRRALAKVPNQRPASAAEFVTELRACERREAHEQESQRLRQAEEERTRREAEREADERERQRQAAEAAALEKSKREAEQRERQQLAAEKQVQRSQSEVPREEKSLPAPTAKWNRKWLYAAGGVIAVVAIAIVLANINPGQPVAPASTALPTIMLTEVPKPTEAPGAGGLTGEITLWHTYRAGGSEEKAIGDAVAQLMKDNPGLTVNVLEIPFDQIENKWTTEVAASGGPDMFTMPNDNLGTWVRGSLAAPVDDLMKDHLGDFSKAGIDGLTVDGKLYGVPGIIKALALAYNNSTVPTPPKTTDDLLALVKSGKKLVVIQSAYYNFGWMQGAFGGSLMDATGKCVADQGTGFTDAFQYLLDLKKAGADFETDGGKADTMVEQGQAEMMVEGPWVLGDFKKALGDKLGIAPMPAGPKGPAQPLSGIDGWYVNPNATPERQKLAVDVGLYLFGVKGAGFWANEAGDPMVANGLTVSDPLVKAYADAAAAGFPRPQSKEFGNWWGPFGDAVTKVMEGTLAPADAVKEACAAMNKANGK